MGRVWVGAGKFDVVRVCIVVYERRTMCARPFFNCPSQQRVGTPARAYDGGKWMCGVRSLLKVRFT